MVAERKGCTAFKECLDTYFLVDLIRRVLIELLRQIWSLYNIWFLSIQNYTCSY